MRLRSFVGLFFVAALTAADWPEFLGPSRNGSAATPMSLNALSKTRLLWKIDVGAGFSAPVVSAGKLVLFHRVDNEEVVEAFAADTGKRVWRFAYPTNYRDDFGFDPGPRGTPTIAGGRVYTFGAEGVLHALEFATGKKLWRVDTHTRFGVRKGFFGAAASPLVDGGLVYVNVGGPNGAGIVAFDANTGEVRWTATNDDAGYSSPVAATVDGVKSILCLTRAGLVALHPATGKQRFQYPWRARNNNSVNAAIPLVNGNLIFLSASYGAGATVLRVTGNQLAQLWASDDSLSNHYASSVQKDGYVYGFHGRQEYGQSLRCIEMKTGKVQWDMDGYGAGTITLLGDTLLIVRESGEAVLAPAAPKAFEPASKLQLLPRVLRSYPAVSDGRIFVRNETQLAAYATPAQ